MSRPQTGAPRTAANVYRMFNADGELLYVGLGAAITRAYQHRIDNSWFRQVTRIEIDHFGTRDEAKVAEADQIRTLHPLYNKDFNPTRYQILYNINQEKGATS